MTGRSAAANGARIGSNAGGIGDPIAATNVVRIAGRSVGTNAVPSAG